MPPHTDFTTIRSEGGLLPRDLLQRLRQGDRDLPGLTPDAYHLIGTTRLSEATSEAWNHLQGAWRAYQNARARLAPNDTGTSLTRERWLLPLFQVLGYGRLVPFTGGTHPISHGWSHVPIHLVGCHVDLDRRTPGIAGAARTSPHALVQTYLNTSPDSLWGIVSNGLRLRLLRDHQRLTRQSYVEYDLETMFDGDVYADFTLLYLTLHQSRFEGERPHDALIEQWSRHAHEAGTRALDRLRDGVERALTSLGQGFQQHPHNHALGQRLTTGDLSATDYYRQLLRLIYRLLVLFAAEDRDLLHPPGTSDEVRARYHPYGTRALRTVADRVAGGPHPDRYESFKLLTRWLGGDGAPALGVPALGSTLFHPTATPDLDTSVLANRAFLRAVRALSTTSADGARTPIDYKNLGAEELGSVYESLLELHPVIDPTAGTFALTTAAGSERKTTGSYYTPTSLITLLLDSALDPVLDEAARAPDPERAILDLKIVDPASGSGHFLIAAAHRTARRLAQARTGDDEPPIDATRTALRDVISHCLYAVDLNPMATELCKVALWLEALEPGKPLSFLDHHIKTGNSLIGTDPHKTIEQIVDDGIPDDAYKPVTGDDKEATRAARDDNKQERRGARALFGTTATPSDDDLASAHRDLDAHDDTTIHTQRAKEAAYQTITDSDSYRRARDTADAWVTAFLGPKTPTESPITTGDLHALHDGRALPDDRTATIRATRQRHQPFHWRIEYPDAFDRTKDGFDIVLGNPPWDRIKLQEKEWFATRAPDIANAATTATRGKLIQRLKEDAPNLYAEFLADVRVAEGETHVIRNGGRYPLCGRGDINTYAIFAELNRQLMGSRGRAGFIVPSGIATDDTTKHYFRAINDENNLVSLYDFENRLRIFPGIDSRIKFALVTLTGSDRPAAQAQFVFFAHQVADVLDPERGFTLSADDLALLSPNTGNCPVFRTARDKEVVTRMRRGTPVWRSSKQGTDANGDWDIAIRRIVDINLASTKLTAVEPNNTDWRQSQTHVRVYEGKMFSHFNHRLADAYTVEQGQRSGRARALTSDELLDPHRLAQPRFLAPRSMLDDGLQSWKRNWLIGYMDVCSPTNERTVIPAVLPESAPTFSVRVVAQAAGTPEELACLVANLGAYCFDYYVRQFVGGLHLSDFIMYQMAVIPRRHYPLARKWLGAATEPRHWIAQRILELSYVAHDLQPLASDLGYNGPPFQWIPERRAALRAEIDSLFFHLYGLCRDDVSFVMDSFPIVRRRDESMYGTYRTKDAVLAIYDEMAACYAEGRPYASPLDPLRGRAPN